MRITLFVLLLVIWPVTQAACKAQKQVTLTPNTSNVTQLQINALAGILEVSKGNALTVEGSVCTSHDRWLPLINVETEQSGDVLEVTVVIPRDESGQTPDYASVDLIVRVPDHLTVAIRDSSGDIEVTSVRVSEIDDSSGSIDLDNTSGDTRLRDSSGDIRLRDHDGSLLVTDSSGNLTFNNVSGHIEIERDSSGNIDIDTAASVNIEADGSGEIEAREITGDVRVGSDGSGGIRIRNVGGNVSVDRDGSGNINVAQVTGNLTVGAKGSGKVNSRDVQGEIRIP